MNEIKNYKTISNTCNNCRGKLFVENQAERESAVFAEFGIIPNNCVDDESGFSHRCPYRKANLTNNIIHQKIS